MGWRSVRRLLIEEGKGVKMRFKIMGLCLVAAFAFSAFATSAFSYTIWHGKKATTLTELKSGEKVTYTLKSSGEAFLRGGATITCKSFKGKGELVGPNLSKNVVVEYSKCDANETSGLKCTSPGAGAGKIITALLKGELAGAKQEKTSAAVLTTRLTPQTGTEFTKFACGPLKEIEVNVTGVIYAENQPQTGPPALKTGKSINGEKPAETEFGCGKQKFLYVAGACEHLFTPGGTSWNVSTANLKYKEFVEVRP
jgi:hypothetical protein